jgi:hypothetical protein
MNMSYGPQMQDPGYQQGNVQPYAPMYAQPMTMTVKKPGSALVTLGIVLGIIGAILAGVGVMLWVTIFDSQDYNTIKNIYKAFFVLVGLGVILAGLGVGLFRLGKEKQI